jgi:polysaccharide biosynthesis/export protein
VKRVYFSSLVMIALVMSGLSTTTSIAQRAPASAPPAIIKETVRAQQMPATPSENTDGAVTLPSYRIGGGDRLKISVYNVDKLSGEYPVSGDGKIAFPMLGRIPVSGLTLDEIATAIASRLGEGYFINPVVTVDIAAYRPVFILGEIEKPGEYPFKEGLTVYRLVAEAGGFTYRANRRKIRVHHDGAVEGKKYRVTDDSAVLPGDTVYVMQRYF